MLSDSTNAQKAGRIYHFLPFCTRAAETMDNRKDRAKEQLVNI
jgi:hypothetical protein